MPTPKARAIDDLLTDLMGMSRDEAEAQGICVSCRGPVDGFRDSLSRREYAISGLCQACQDATFGAD